MQKMAFEDLINSDGASRITEVELIYRSKCKASERRSISSSSAAYQALMDSWDMNKIELQEQFKVMLLDRKNGCMGISTVATGGITSCLVDLKIVFATAIKASATKIILAHNHPSGNTVPSLEDKSLTERFAQVGMLLQLPVIDHLIVTKEGYTSFADEGFILSGR